MKLSVRKPPSRSDVVQLVMAMCSRERLAELAHEKGLKVGKQMSKKELCEAILT